MKNTPTPIANIYTILNDIRWHNSYRRAADTLLLETAPLFAAPVLMDCDSPASILGCDLPYAPTIQKVGSSTIVRALVVSSNSLVHLRLAIFHSPSPLPLSLENDSGTIDDSSLLSSLLEGNPFSNNSATPSLVLQSNKTPSSSNPFVSGDVTDNFTDNFTDLDSSPNFHQELVLNRDGQSSVSLNTSTHDISHGSSLKTTPPRPTLSNDASQDTPRKLTDDNHPASAPLMSVGGNQGWSSDVTPQKLRQPPLPSLALSSNPFVSTVNLKLNPFTTSPGVSSMASNPFKSKSANDRSTNPFTLGFDGTPQNMLLGKLTSDAQNTHQCPLPMLHLFHMCDPEMLMPGQFLSLGGALENPAEDVFYVSSDLQTAVRVSLYAQEWDKSLLTPFLDPAQILVRHSAVRPDQPPPSSASCLKTLINAMRGPLNHKDSDVQRHIAADNQTLAAHVGADFLVAHLGFVPTANGLELVPPDLDGVPGYRDTYARKVLELIHIARSDCSWAQFTVAFGPDIRFADAAPLCFNALPETVTPQSIKSFADHSMGGTCRRQYWSLASAPYWPDEAIRVCFKALLDHDPKHAMYYIASLETIAHARSSASLAQLANALSERLNTVPLATYTNALKALGVPPVPPPQSPDPELLVAVHRACVRAEPQQFAFFDRQLGILAKALGLARLANALARTLVPVSAAATILGIEDLTEDEVVITALEFLVEDTLAAQPNNPEAVLVIERSFVLIGVSRKSPALLHYAETRWPQLIDSMCGDHSPPPEIACKRFGCVPEELDIGIALAYLGLCAQVEPQDILLLRQSMRVIANHRKLDMLFSILEKGALDPALIPANKWPAGLANIGNTCYLNLLLQYYYCLKPLREAILDVPYPRPVLELDAQRKIGGRAVAADEVTRLTQFVAHWAQLMTEMCRSPHRCVKPSRELAYLALLPLAAPVEFGENALDSPLALLPIVTDQMDSAIEAGRQQDVTECIDNVTFQVETALCPERLEADDEQYDIVKNLFCGRIQQTLRPVGAALDDERGRVSYERFFSLIVNISDRPRDIYDALDSYFDEDVVALEGGSMSKTLAILELPAVLQFHVQRVMFDRERLVAYKLAEPIPFGETIYLDRYMTTNDPEMIRRKQQACEWRAARKRVLAERVALGAPGSSGLSIVDLLMAAQRFIERGNAAEYGANEVLAAALADQAAIARERLENLAREEAALTSLIDEQFSNDTQAGYVVMAVFIHRGEASYGHYWVYILDPHSGTFRKYNDEQVTEVKASEVFDFSPGNTATPYYIVYVKQELAEEYVEPLHREIAKQTKDPQEVRIKEEL